MAGRKRVELGSDVEARIALGVKRGETHGQVAKAIGASISARTIARRMREIRGPVQAPRHGAKPAAATETRAATPLPTSPDEIPEGASLPELTGLLDRCKSALTQAETDENLPLVGQMIRVAAQLSETIRKATPPKQADPNDAPDMVALRTEAARRWHEMVDLVADG
jgi:hypothetical protein